METIKYTCVPSFISMCATISKFEEKCLSMQYTNLRKILPGLFVIQSASVLHTGGRCY